MLERRGRGAAPRAVSLARRWSLTPRQVEVLALVAEGYTNRRIAAELGCASRTVEAHVTALLDKAGCETRSQLVARVWQETSR